MPRKIHFLPACLVFLFVFQPIHSIWFTIGGNTRKCFYEQVSSNSYIALDWRIEPIESQDATYKHNSALRNPLTIEVMNEDGESIFKEVNQLKGNVTVETFDDGFHQICFIFKPSSRSIIYKFHIEIRSGLNSINYSQIVTNQNLDQVSLTIRKLTDLVSQLQSRISSHKTKRGVERTLSEAAYSRILYWSVVQVLIIMGSTYWQNRQLKRIFSQKKTR